MAMLSLGKNLAPEKTFRSRFGLGMGRRPEIPRAVRLHWSRKLSHEGCPRLMAMLSFMGTGGGRLRRRVCVGRALVLAGGGDPAGRTDYRHPAGRIIFHGLGLGPGEASERGDKQKIQGSWMRSAPNLKIYLSKKLNFGVFSPMRRMGMRSCVSDFSIYRVPSRNGQLSRKSAFGSAAYC